MDELDANNSDGSAVRSACFAPLCRCIAGISLTAKRQQKSSTVSESEEREMKKNSKEKKTTNAIDGIFSEKKTKKIHKTTNDCNGNMGDGNSNTNAENCKMANDNDVNTEIFSVNNNDNNDIIANDGEIRKKKSIDKPGKGGLKRRVSSFFKRRQQQQKMSDEDKPKVDGSAPAASGSNGNASDSSEVELLLANEEEQEVELSFARGEANERAETSDASPQIAVQQFAKSALTTAASRDADKFRPEGVEEERIPCRRTSMLTRQEDQTTAARRDSSGSVELEVISVEALERRAQRQRALIAGATAVVGITLGALLIRRIVSHR